MCIQPNYIGMRPTQNKNTSSYSYKERASFWIEVVGFSITVFGAGYCTGRWTADREHKEEIILLNQKHNNELTDLKIDFNNQIMEQKTINRELQDKLNNSSKKGEPNE